MSVAILFLTILFSLSVKAQKPFEGVLVYKVEMLDTNVQKLIDARMMTVFTNDTLSRIDLLNDALGEQVTIKHLTLKKSYLLMNMMGKNLAIQTDETDDTTTVEPYLFKYKLLGSKKVNGYTLKKAKVTRSDLGERRTIWFFKDIRPDLMNMYPGIKGLPAEFYIGTVDGIVHYTLVSIENKPIHRDIFGIPSDFEKINLRDFMKYVKSE